MSKIKEIKQLLDDCRASGCNDERIVAELSITLDRMLMEPKKTSEYGELKMAIKVYDDGERICCHVKECEPCTPGHVKAVHKSLEEFIEAKKQQIDAELSDTLKDVIERMFKAAKGAPT